MYVSTILIKAKLRLRKFILYDRYSSTECSSDIIINSNDSACLLMQINCTINQFCPPYIRINASAIAIAGLQITALLKPIEALQERQK